MFLHKTPSLLRAVYPRLTWRVPTTADASADYASADGASSERMAYLTFDDGPVPEVTDFVLDQLGRFGAQGTFFCIGDNVRKHPEVFGRVLAAGHAVGNHTFHHLNGWQTPPDEYLRNFRACQEVLPAGTRLFRPPYGRITRRQARAILTTHAVVMWDVLTGDFSADLRPEMVLKKTLQHTEPGSIVVFHDSVKAFRSLRYALPRTLDALAERGYRFGRVPSAR